MMKMLISNLLFIAFMLFLMSAESIVNLIIVNLGI